MAENTKIEWAHHTFNPWIGCTKISPGCANCYAEEMMDRRYGRAQWGDAGTRVRTTPAYWTQPFKWDARARSLGIRSRVFCASLADVFEDRPELDEPFVLLLDTIRQTPRLDWLLLTKRPWSCRPRLVRSVTIARGAGLDDLAEWINTWLNGGNGIGYPPRNVWLGTSVENQEAADKRIDGLFTVPAAVRFLSCEPLLGPVDLSKWIKELPDPLGYYTRQTCLDWVIVGGESGRNARPMDPYWARQIRDRCAAAEVPFFFKQWG